MNPAEELLGAIARGWCHPKNAGKVMDPDLAVAIAAEVNAIRPAHSEAVERDAARYRWLRDTSAEQYEHPIAVSQTRTDVGMRYVGPVLGKALDDAIDAERVGAEENLNTYRQRSAPSQP